MVVELPHKPLPRFSGQPGDEELSAFVASMLLNLPSHLRGPDVVDEMIGRHREIWVMAYRASLSPPARLPATHAPPRRGLHLTDTAAGLEPPRLVPRAGSALH